jgi:hypothetical protein
MVPSPEMTSLIEPDHVPAGDTTNDVGGGNVGVVLPPQPAALSISAMTGASRRFIPNSCELGAAGVDNLIVTSTPLAHYSPTTRPLTVGYTAFADDRQPLSRAYAADWPY